MQLVYDVSHNIAKVERHKVNVGGSAARTRINAIPIRTIDLRIVVSDSGLEKCIYNSYYRVMNL